ncbi:alpha/beta hydrolase [Pararhodobacter sp. SW119]|uniref:alpha/beta hydrolase n=1 Tax=Pararhodobacter sp. SW119 TaxID=2780075 RepID=UPI001ADF8099|nr:alpha/beta hydrolase [Pararhodobacter sp. SW119]
MRALYPHTELKIDRHGVTLHCEIYGDGPETIVFIPTWMFIHSRGYKSQIPYFSDRFRCITWDPRGNGKSDRPTDPSQFGQGHYVADALAVMDATDIDRAILFGLSQSGPTCAILASYHPDRVRAVIAVGAHSPLVPRFPHNSVESYNSDLGDREPQGWEKYNRGYWRRNYADFADFFAEQLFVEPHSTKQQEDVRGWADGTTGDILAASMAAPYAGQYQLDEQAYRRIRCPMLLVHGRKDTIAPVAASEKVAELTGCEIHIFEEGGHVPNARFPGQFNTLMRDFLARHLGTWAPGKPPRRRAKAPKRALYLSSPIGLGHARRDVAITQALRALHPDIQVDWLAQDPVTRLLEANDERLHPGSARLASETAHIEEESGEHDLNAFQAIRRMDEILIKNFMVFQETVEEGGYDLVIADEAWDIDHYWHEHPGLKKSAMVWLTDFVGWVPMPEGGAHEAFLTSDYNAEMIGHVENNPTVRDRSIFVGNPEDVVPLGFGEGLPMMRDWVPRHYDFAGYVMGAHPSGFGPREALRARVGYGPDEKVCIVTVGGSGVGAHLIRRILHAWPLAKEAVPELRMIVVTGPRLDPASLNAPPGVELRAFVPDLDRHLACCDLALVQGGLTTCMELAAAGTPFLYFPLRNHFEQNIHVAHRLDRYEAGRRMIFATSPPETIAEAMVAELTTPRRPHPVEADGAARAARMIAAVL